MGKIIKANQPCPLCDSHDAVQVYEDGAFCFSCGKQVHRNKGAIQEDSPMELKVPRSALVKEISLYATRGFKERGITKNVCEFFGVRVSYDEDGAIDTHYYPYNNYEGYKIRKLPKEFSFVGKSGGLFGMEKFSPGGKRLTITEGEIDALSVAQSNIDKYNSIFPVVSLSSATATNALLDARDWIRSFDEVVLMMDNDKAGEEALSKAIKVIGLDKIKVAVYPNDCKDASDILVKHGANTLHQVIWNSKPWSPAGIIGKDELWAALQAYNLIPSVPYPDCLAGVNSKLKGKRQGEITLFISGTGAGKSTIMREEMLHTLEITNDKIGVISLEEAPAETAKKLAGMVLNRNPADEEIPIDELKIGFDKVFNSDRVVLLDHQGSIKDNSIIDQLEYMCLVGCKYIYIDHITILVSEGADGLTGNEAIDKIMNSLLSLVKRHPVWIGLISHLRKTPGGGKSFEEGRLPSIDDIRGSGSIKQISFDVIAFSRNLTAKEEEKRNTIRMSILKARTTGLTGPVVGAKYVHSTGRLHALDYIEEDEDVFVKI
jgi:twinkle protein